VSYNLSDVVAAAAANAMDPDRRNYPHLFEVKRITDEDIRKHQANYGPDASCIEHPYQYLGTLAKQLSKPIYTEEQPRYLGVAGTHKTVSATYLKEAGWVNPECASKRYVRPRVSYVEPDTWLDAQTGWILTKTEARANSVRIPLAGSISERMLHTAVRVNQCAPKEREFVAYVLNMRNRRGGLVEDLNRVLDRWIDHKYPHILSTDRARKRNALEAILAKRRIMVNSQTLASDLQILGNPTKQEIIEESARTYSVLPIAGTFRRSTGETHAVYKTGTQ
jgi:hypothetical protein